MAESTLAAWALPAIVALGLLLVALAAVVIAKSRPFRAGDVFAASRLTRGNRLFPTQVAILPTSVVQCKQRWFGREEQSIHIGHVASITIQTGVLFSDVIIETSGGSEPIVCHGHTKGDAMRMKELIEGYQDSKLRGTTAVGGGFAESSQGRL
jgi:hypothetical protein